MTRTLAFTLCLGLAACGGSDSWIQKTSPSEDQTKTGKDLEKDAGATTDPTVTDPTDPGETPSDASAPACTPPAGVSNDPQSMEAAIALINALPKPLSMKCYLEVLRRPLKVNATDSQLSVQPAKSPTSPRIFLFSGSLITTFVTEGEGSGLMEFSLLLSTQTSIKGELPFPVMTAQSPDAAYLAIKRDGSAGTRCAGCHFSEVLAPSTMSEHAFVSRALKPFDRNDVDLTILKAASTSCAGVATDRCGILRAVFEHGEVKPEAFPFDMPTLF